MKRKDNLFLTRLEEAVQVITHIRSISLKLLLSNKNFIYGMMGVLICSVSLITWLIFFESWRIPETQLPHEIFISPGMTSRSIADTLFQYGIIPSKSRFLTAVKWLGVAQRLQAGHYVFIGRLTNHRILDQMLRGKVVLEKITFYEGIRAREMALLLSEKVHVDPDSFLALVFNRAYTESLGIAAPNLEGYLYPDTYYFRQDISPREVIEMMIRNFKSVVSDSLEVRAAEMNMTLHQVITLASIIEGEAARADERTIISALYHNRLRRGMLLQACPTIQYLLPGSPRRLLSRDLEIDSPYNTYQHAGLPPGPINNPGIASIHAALYPADVPFLYMVANGDGSHTFSRTIEEHNRAKQRFEKLRRQVEGRR